MVLCNTTIDVQNLTHIDTQKILNGRYCRPEGSFSERIWHSYVHNKEVSRNVRWTWGIETQKDEGTRHQVITYR